MSENYAFSPNEYRKIIQEVAISIKNICFLFKDSKNLEEEEEMIKKFKQHYQNIIKFISDLIRCDDSEEIEFKKIISDFNSNELQTLKEYDELYFNKYKQVIQEYPDIFYNIQQERLQIKKNSLPIPSERRRNDLMNNFNQLKDLSSLKTSINIMKKTENILKLYRPEIVLTEKEHAELLKINQYYTGFGLLHLNIMKLLKPSSFKDMSSSTLRKPSPPISMARFQQTKTEPVTSAPRIIPKDSIPSPIQYLFDKDQSQKQKQIIEDPDTKKEENSPSPNSLIINENNSKNAAIAVNNSTEMEKNQMELNNKLTEENQMLKERIHELENEVSQLKNDKLQLEEKMKKITKVIKKIAFISDVANDINDVKDF